MTGDPLGILRQRFPRYLIMRYPDPFGRADRYHAWTSDLTLPVSAVISDDPAEITAALSVSAGTSDHKKRA